MPYFTVVGVLADSDRPYADTFATWSPDAAAGQARSDCATSGLVVCAVLDGRPRIARMGTGRLGRSARRHPDLPAPPGAKASTQRVSHSLRHGRSATPPALLDAVAQVVEQLSAGEADVERVTRRVADRAGLAEREVASLAQRVREILVDKAAAAPTAIRRARRAA